MRSRSVLDEQIIAEAVKRASWSYGPDRSTSPSSGCNTSGTSRSSKRGCKHLVDAVATGKATEACTRNSIRWRRRRKLCCANSPSWI